MATSLQPDSSPEKAPSSSTTPDRSSPAEKRVTTVQALEESDSDKDDHDEENAPLVMKAIRAVLGWMTPYEQMTFLRRKRDVKRWELFRDALMRRWSNLNVIVSQRVILAGSSQLMVLRN